MSIKKVNPKTSSAMNSWTFSLQWSLVIQMSASATMTSLAILGCREKSLLSKKFKKNFNDEIHKSRKFVPKKLKHTRLKNESKKNVVLNVLNMLNKSGEQKKRRKSARTLGPPLQARPNQS